MAIELFHGETLMWGQCLRRWPRQAMLGVFLGMSVVTLAFITIAGIAQFREPLIRPSLQLVDTVVDRGGVLGFKVGGTARPCPQETSRWVWRVRDGVREVFPLSPANLMPDLGPGPTIIHIELPQSVGPGDWFYTRETQDWCSVFNYLPGVGPTVTRTRDVPFTVR